MSQTSWIGEVAVHVLVVDDSPQILYLICELVTSLGWQCHTAANGVDALRMAQELTPDLIVSDIQMPGINGLELIHSIRSRSGLSHIPTILISAADLREEALAAGCDAFLSKPFDVESLVGVMRRLVEGSEDTVEEQE